MDMFLALWFFFASLMGGQDATPIDPCMIDIFSTPTSIEDLTGLSGQSVDCEDQRSRFVNEKFLYFKQHEIKLPASTRDAADLAKAYAEEKHLEELANLFGAGLNAMTCTADDSCPKDQQCYPRFSNVRVTGTIKVTIVGSYLDNNGNVVFVIWVNTQGEATANVNCRCMTEEERALELKALAIDISTRLDRLR